MWSKGEGTSDLNEDDMALLCGDVSAKLTSPLSELSEKLEALRKLNVSAACEPELNREIERHVKYLEFRQRDFTSKFDEALAALDFTFGSAEMSYRSPFDGEGRFHVQWFGAARALRSLEEQDLVSSAKTERFAYEFALHMIAGELEDYSEGREVKIDPHLAGFASEVLRGTLKKPKQKGLHFLQTWSKRRDVCLMVEICCELGLRPYRNDVTPEHESACDAVALHMKRRNATPASYEGVRKLWAKRDQIRSELADAVGRGNGG